VFVQTLKQNDVPRCRFCGVLYGFNIYHNLDRFYRKKMFF